MREIAAASNFDFIAAEPRRSGRAHAQRRGKDSGKRREFFPPWVKFVWRHRTPIFGGASLFALLTMIAVNAMFLQRGRDPAPLFGATFKFARPAPAARPTSIESLLREYAPRAAPAPAPSKSSHDAIGALIAHGRVAPPSAHEVRAAQRALHILGVPVVVDGEYGPATRKAIEDFQRLNHLPVSGELTVRTRRLLEQHPAVRRR